MRRTNSSEPPELPGIGNDLDPDERAAHDFFLWLLAIEKGGKDRSDQMALLCHRVERLEEAVFGDDGTTVTGSRRGGPQDPHLRALAARQMEAQVGQN